MKKIIPIVKIFSITLCIFTLIFGIIIWFILPETVPVHFDLSLNPTRYGSKVEMFFLLLLPLIGFLPLCKNEKQYHSTDTETLEKAANEREKSKKTKVIAQLLISLFCCIITIVLLIATLNNV